MVIIYLVLCFILLFLVFYKDHEGFYNQSTTPIILDNNITLDDKLIIGKSRPKTNNELDVEKDIYADRHCLKNDQERKTCINRRDILNLSQEPNYSHKNICIGNTCINSNHIKLLKDMRNDKQIVNSTRFDCNKSNARNLSYCNPKNYDIHTYPNNKLRTAYEEIDNQRLNSRINTNYGGGATYGDCTGSWDDYSFRTDRGADNRYYLNYVVGHR